MGALLHLYAADPFWVWVGAAAILLAVEALTGSGYLLWPAGSAGVVAVLTLFTHLGLPKELVVFAVLTLVSTFVGRRYLRPAPVVVETAPNERARQLVGRVGEIVGEFKAGQGRVFVDGAEWMAEAEPTAVFAPGARVEVAEVVGGGRLRVKAAGPA
jgi:membrane protein implicated in regulation of membrane protease activity